MEPRGKQLIRVGTGSRPFFSLRSNGSLDLDEVAARFEDTERVFVATVSRVDQQRFADRLQQFSSRINEIVVQVKRG